jgi:hypothetical protein
VGSQKYSTELRRVRTVHRSGWYVPLFDVQFLDPFRVEDADSLRSVGSSAGSTRAGRRDYLSPED